MLSSGVPAILITNKSDDVEHKMISTDIGTELARQISIPSYDCSAKTKEGVHAAINSLLEKIIKAKPSESLKPGH